MSIMLIMSCYTGFFNVRRGWQSLNTGPRFYLRLIRRTGWLWIFTSRTTDGRPFKPKKLSVPFPDLDPSVNLIGHAAITEMIKLQFTTITDRIQNKIQNGNWFPKLSINRKEQKFLPICLQLLTLLMIIKDPSLRGLRGNQDRQKFDFWQPQAVNMFAGH